MLTRRVILRTAGLQSMQSGAGSVGAESEYGDDHSAAFGANAAGQALDPALKRLNEPELSDAELLQAIRSIQVRPICCITE